MRILATIHNEGFTCQIIEHDDGRVEMPKADADIDADGANGQNGKRPAYMVDNKGSELLGNGGMTMRDGKVVGNTSWFDDIVILDGQGNPREFPGGIIASKTSYRFPGKDANDPAAYVDSETVPYIVVPPSVISGTKGAVMGCKARATNLKTGLSAEGLVADGGPRNKVGELSIEMARRLGLNPSPRTGGVEEPIIRYECWPGVPANVDGVEYRLQRSNGTYV